MDRVRFLAILDRIARVLRVLGLSTVTGLAKRLVAGQVRTPLSVEVAGLQLAGSIQHRGYLHRLREGQREAYMSELFCSVVRPGMTVIDAGAYLGWYALLAAQRFGPDGEVFAFEPNPETFPYLVHNVKVNRLSDRILTLPVALSDTASKLPFQLNLEDPSQSSLYPVKRSTTRLVECAPLDDLLDSSVRVDVVKIDVEGAELRTLRGMRSVLQRAQEDLVMFVECNPFALASAETSVDNLVRALQELDLEILMIDEEKRLLAPFDPQLAARKTHNLYCGRRIRRSIEASS